MVILRSKPFLKIKRKITAAMPTIAAIMTPRSAKSASKLADIIVRLYRIVYHYGLGASLGLSPNRMIMSLSGYSVEGVVPNFFPAFCKMRFVDVSSRSKGRRGSPCAGMSPILLYSSFSPILIF